MKKYKVVVNKIDCLGCGACVSVCKNFYMDKGGKADVKKSEITEKEFSENKKAEKICPVQAIIITEKK